jgi:hypothetical protein
MNDLRLKKLEEENERFSFTARVIITMLAATLSVWLIFF